MLKGEELAKALREAMIAKGNMSSADLAREFKVQPPSVSEWRKFGRIDKKHINHLISFFSDVVTPDHWGLDDGSIASVSNPSPSLSDHGKLSPEATRLVNLISKAEATKSVSADSWKLLSGLVAELMSAQTNVARTPKRLRD